MAVLGALNFLFRAETSSFRKELKSVGRDVKKLVNGSFRLLRTSMASIGAGAGAFGAIAVAVGKANQETEKWAKNLGLPVARLTALKDVAAEFGLEGEKVADAIKDLNERISDAAGGNKTYEAALKMVNLASKDLIALRADEQYLKVADAIAKMNIQADKNFVVAELMADAGFEQIGMWDQLNGKLEENVLAAENSEMAMSALEQGGVSSMTTAVDKLWASLGKLADKITAYVAPVIETLANMISDNIQAITDGLKTVLNTIARIGFWVGEDASLSDLISGKTWDDAGKKADKLFRSTASARMNAQQEEARVAQEAIDRKAGAEKKMLKMKADAEAKEVDKIFAARSAKMKEEVDKFQSQKGAAAQSDLGQTVTLAAQQIDPNQMRLGGASNVRSTEDKQLEKQTQTADNTSEIAINLIEMKNMFRDNIFGGGPSGAVFGTGGMA